MSLNYENCDECGEEGIALTSHRGSWYCSDKCKGLIEETTKEVPTHTSLLSALSTGLAQCTKEGTPEALTQLVETMNTELGHLGVFKVNPPAYYSAGTVHLVMLQQPDKILSDAFAQLNYLAACKVYYFCEKKVDLTYQSLYDALVGFLSDPQNILQLNLNNLTIHAATGDAIASGETL